MHNIHTGQIAALARQLANRQLPGARERPGKGAGKAGRQRLPGGCGETAGAMLTSSPSGRSWQLPLGTRREGRTGDEWATEFPGPLGNVTTVAQSAVLRISEGGCPSIVIPPPTPTALFSISFPRQERPNSLVNLFALSLPLAMNEFILCSAFWSSGFPRRAVREAGGGSATSTSPSLLPCPPQSQAALHTINYGGRKCPVPDIRWG